MNFYFQKSKSTALSGVYSSIYNIPEVLLQSALPCEIVIEIKKLFYNKIIYVEPYSNQFEPIMHLEAMIFAIENRLAMEFHLSYTPIFDVKFEETNIILIQGKRKRFMPIDNFLVQLRACLAGPEQNFLNLRTN